MFNGENMTAHKILKCIPSLAAHGAIAQAANMINVVKASIEVSQEYKDQVCVLPQHFVTMMFDLYVDAMYAMQEAAMMDYNKDMIMLEAEKKFTEKSSKAVSVLSNTAKILEVLRNDMSAAYEEVALEMAPKETILENSIEAMESEPSVQASVVEAAAPKQTIDEMISYVKLMKPEQRLALIYSLGLTSYVDLPSITTSSVEAVAEEEMISPIELETNINSGSEESLMFGIYVIKDIEEKMKEAMLSHQFTTDNLEYDVLYTVVENIADKTIDEVTAEVKEKLGITEGIPVSSVDDLLDYLDQVGENLTNKLAPMGHVLFTIKGADICMLAAFTKEDANSLLAKAKMLLTPGYLSELRSKLIAIKSDMKDFTDSVEDADESHDHNETVELARTIYSQMEQLYSKFNADSEDVEILEETEAAVRSKDKVSMEAFGGGFEVYINDYDSKTREKTCVVSLNGFGSGSVDYLGNSLLLFPNLEKEIEDIVEDLHQIYNEADKKVTRTLLAYNLTRRKE